MGIPRFYRWLKDRYPLIRMDLNDTTKELPIFDNFYIDFNALVYQCIRQSGCFLKNKIKPLTFEHINQRVVEYLLELVRVVNPRKLLFIAFDGVAPRAKINQSRDRRFRSGIQDIEFFDELMEKVGIKTKQIFESNSISPGTEFLYNLCNLLKSKILELMNTEWKGLNVFYSDCCVPGEGEHKIMDFLRYTKQIQLFNKNTTHCVYSPDADVILLTLTLNLDYICIIKEDTSVMPSMNWTANSTYRKVGPPQFEFAMINILREYLQRQFEKQLKEVQNCTIQKIINDFVLLMAFVGNDFLPLEFCFALKDNHMDELFSGYKEYLNQHQSFINNDGVIDWGNVSNLLKVAKKFEANRINQMKNQRKVKQSIAKEQQTVFDPIQRQKESEDKEGSQIQHFQIQDQKIVNGVGYYYQTRFNIQDRKNSQKFHHIIKKYIQGLQFYCQYYYKGLPSWTWCYTYHYTPLICDVYDYLLANKINVQLKKDAPFDPVLALMFMLPEQNFGLLPKPVSEALLDRSCILRSPYDFYPLEFSLDKFETLKYNKRAMIEFLNDQDVRKVYERIPKDKYTKEQLLRNQRKNTIFFYSDKDSFIGAQMTFDQKSKQFLKKFVRPRYQGKQKDSNQKRFPTLTIYGDKFKINEKGKIICEKKYKYQGNPAQLVFFNNFIGYVQKFQKADAGVREDIEGEYEKKAGISGTCQTYYIIKRGQPLRQVQRFHVAPTRKEVIVPDFALFKAPNYDYIHKTQKYQYKQLYELKERVVVLTGKYFGCTGTIEELGDKQLKVKLSFDPIKAESRIEQSEEEFYTIEYVLNELEIQKETLFAIISEVIVLPVMKKKGQFNERLPTALNFGLNFIDIYNIKIVPKFVRCNFNFENTRNPQAVFDFLEFSQSALKVLQKYVQIFHWLVQLLEENRSNKLRKEFKASGLFPKHKQPNIQAYKEFIKLYELDTKGCYTSIYTKSADMNKLPKMYTQKKGSNAIVTLAYHQVISRNLALQSPPPYRAEPQYHDLGSRVILLKNLEVGYVVCIDNQWIHIILGKEKRRAKVKFTDLYNQSWENFLNKDVGKCWNLEVGYYTPTYWKKAISAKK